MSTFTPQRVPVSQTGKEVSARLREQWVEGWKFFTRKKVWGGGYALAALWFVGIFGDAASTFFMMRSGLFEEANPFAALGMFHIGMEAYIVIASLVCVFVFSIPTLAKPQHNIYACTLWISCFVVCLVKIYVAVSNISLAYTVM